MHGNRNETRTRRRAQCGEEGVALMIVLLFVLLLSVIVTEFAYEIQVEASLATNTNRDAQAYIAAKSAVASGMGLLRADLMADDIMSNAQAGANATRQQLQQQNRQQQQQQMQGQDGAQDYDGLTDIWAQGVPNQMLNDATMQCSISDEYGKLNLNALVTEDGQVNETLVTALRTLFANLGLEKDPTDAILDWVDSDDDPRPEGAESDAYEGLETPYTCKNGQMDSIEELLLIADIPAEFYFDALIYLRGEGGGTTGKNGKSTVASQELEEEDMEPVSLADLLTVHGDPTGAVNVNTARPELLEALLDSMNQGSGAPIDQILMDRLEDPYHSLEDFQSRAGVNASNVQQGGVRTNQQNTNTNTTQNTNGAHSNSTGSPKSGGPKAQKDPPANPDPTTNPVPNPNALNQQAQGPFSVRSDVFRLFGDGQSGNVMVRIEAYVFRVNDMNGMYGTNPNTNDGTRPDNKPDGAKSRKSPEDNSHKKNNNASKSEFGLKGPASGQNAMETFRILDWRVIR